MTLALFRKPKYTLVTVRKKEIPGGLWVKCEDCAQITFKKDLEEALRVCPKCNYHFTLGARERIATLIDEGTFEELFAELTPADPLGFRGPKGYKEKLKEDQEATGLSEAIVTGEGKLDGRKVVIGVTDSRFIMGTLSSVVGERITRAVELATQRSLPVILVSASGGGARMYEGVFSLMQMAKTSAALGRHHDKGLVYLSVLTHPTMAGVMASFASLGDVILAEPRALIGFTGPRVIEQTIRQKLPEGFQRSEFLLEHGLLDMIVHRKQLKSTLSQLLDYLSYGKNC